MLQITIVFHANREIIVFSKTKNHEKISILVTKIAKFVLPSGNLPSAVILMSATSAGVPTKAPTQPAAIPSAALVRKFGWPFAL